MNNEPPTGATGLELSNVNGMSDEVSRLMDQQRQLAVASEYNKVQLQKALVADQMRAAQEAMRRLNAEEDAIRNQAATLQNQQRPNPVARIEEVPYNPPNHGVQSTSAQSRQSYISHPPISTTFTQSWQSGQPNPQAGASSSEQTAPNGWNQGHAPSGQRRQSYSQPANAASTSSAGAAPTHGQSRHQYMHPQSWGHQTQPTGNSNAPGGYSSGAQSSAQTYQQLSQRAFQQGQPVHHPQAGHHPRAQYEQHRQPDPQEGFHVQHMTPEQEASLRRFNQHVQQQSTQPQPQVTHSAQAAQSSANSYYHQQLAQQQHAEYLRHQVAMYAGADLASPGFTLGQGSGPQTTVMTDQATGVTSTTVVVPELAQSTIGATVDSYPMSERAQHPSSISSLAHALESPTRPPSAAARIVQSRPQSAEQPQIRGSETTTSQPPSRPQSGLAGSSNAIPQSLLSKQIAPGAAPASAQSPPLRFGGQPSRPSVQPGQAADPVATRTTPLPPPLPAHPLPAGQAFPSVLPLPANILQTAGNQPTYPQPFAPRPTIAQIISRLTNTQLEKAVAQVINLVATTPDKDFDISQAVAYTLGAAPASQKLTVAEFETVLRAEIERRQSFRTQGQPPPFAGATNFIPGQQFRGQQQKPAVNSAPPATVNASRPPYTAQPMVPKTGTPLHSNAAPWAENMPPGISGHRTAGVPAGAPPRPGLSQRPSSNALQKPPVSSILKPAVPKDPSSLARDILQSLGRVKVKAQYNPKSPDVLLAKKSAPSVPSSDDPISEASSAHVSPKRKRADGGGKDELDLLASKQSALPTSFQTVVQAAVQRPDSPPDNVLDPQSIVGFKDAYAKVQKSNAQFDVVPGTSSRHTDPSTTSAPITHSPKVTTPSQPRARARPHSPSPSTSTLPPLWSRIPLSESAKERSMNTQPNAPKTPLFLPSPPPQEPASSFGQPAPPEVVDRIPVPTVPRRGKPQRAYVLVPKAPPWVEEWKRRARTTPRPKAREEIKLYRSDEEMVDPTVSIHGWASSSTRPDEDYALNETHALLDGNEDAQEQPLGAQNAKASNDQTPNTWREGPLVPTTAPFPTEGSMLSDPFKVLTFLPCEWTGCDAKLNSVDTLMRHLATHCYRDASTQKTPLSEIRCQWGNPPCVRSYDQLADLIRHTARHAAVNAPCAYESCDEVFSVESDYVAHVRRRHASHASEMKLMNNPISLRMDESHLPPLPDEVPGWTLHTPQLLMHPFTPEEHEELTEQIEDQWERRMRNRARHLQRKAGWLKGITTPMPGPENPAGYGGFAFLDWLDSRDGFAHGLGPQTPYADPMCKEVDKLLKAKTHALGTPEVHSPSRSLTPAIPSPSRGVSSASGEYPRPHSTATTPIESSRSSSRVQDEWEDEEWANDDVGPMIPVKTAHRTTTSEQNTPDAQDAEMTDADDFLAVENMLS